MPEWLSNKAFSGRIIRAVVLAALFFMIWLPLRNIIAESLLIPIVGDIAIEKQQEGTLPYQVIIGHEGVTLVEEGGNIEHTADSIGYHIFGGYLLLASLLFIQLFDVQATASLLHIILAYLLANLILTILFLLILYGFPVVTVYIFIAETVIPYLTFVYAAILIARNKWDL